MRVIEERVDVAARQHALVVAPGAVAVSLTGTLHRAPQRRAPGDGRYRRHPLPAERLGRERERAHLFVALEHTGEHRGPSIRPWNPNGRQPDGTGCQGVKFAFGNEDHGLQPFLVLIVEVETAIAKFLIVEIGFLCTLIGQLF